MATYINCPIAAVFIVCAFLGYTVDRLFYLSAQIKELKKEVKNYYGKDYEPL